MRKIISWLAGALFIAVLTAVFVEAMYRYYLSSVVSQEIARTFKPLENPSFYAYGVAPWVFDRKQGFVFDQRPWLVTKVSDGAFDSCVSAGQGNRYGNIDRAPDSYSQADLRLMIVGSSYSMVGNQKGQLVSEVLMD